MMHRLNHRTTTSTGSFHLHSTRACRRRFGMLPMSRLACVCIESSPRIKRSGALTSASVNRLPPRITMTECGTDDAGMERLAIRSRGPRRYGLVEAVLEITNQRHCWVMSGYFGENDLQYTLRLNVAGYGPMLNDLALHISSGAAAEEILRTCPARSTRESNSTGPAERYRQRIEFWDDPQLCIWLREVETRKIGMSRMRMRRVQHRQYGDVLEVTCDFRIGSDQLAALRDLQHEIRVWVESHVVVSATPLRRIVLKAGPAVDVGPSGRPDIACGRLTFP